MFFFVGSYHGPKIVLLFVSVKLDKSLDEFDWFIFGLYLHRVIVLQRDSYSCVRHMMVSVSRNSIVAHLFHIKFIFTYNVGFKRCLLVLLIRRRNRLLQYTGN